MTKNDIKKELERSNKMIASKIEEHLVEIEKMIAWIRRCQSIGPDSFPIELHKLNTYSMLIWSASDRIMAQQQVIRMIEQNERGIGSW